jgi:Zn finger protein HypA/HybF involved in hydrogenase expression
MNKTGELTEETKLELEERETWVICRKCKHPLREQVPQCGWCGTVTKAAA